MALTAAKNLPLTAAATDLGLGDALKEQVQSDVLTQRTKLMKQQAQMTSALGPSASSAALALGLGGSVFGNV